MKRLLPILPVLLLALSACQTGNDKDWNLSFYNNCGMPRGDSMQWIEQGENKFIRFQLRDKDYGECSSDRMERSRAPYWERAELKQSSFLDPNTKYELALKTRIVKGFSGDRESFLQMHAHDKPCNAKPPVMIKISDGELLLAAQRVGGGHEVHYSGISIGDLIGKWNNVKLNFDTSSDPEISLYLNDKEVFSKIPFWIEACGSAHFKFGIYRPGNVNEINNHSIADFDKIILTKIKKVL